MEKQAFWHGTMLANTTEDGVADVLERKCAISQNDHAAPRRFPAVPTNYFKEYVMPSYRITISRPSTLPPLVDWAQTVVAPNQDQAIGGAYQNWVNSDPTPAAPPLSLCRVSARPSAQAMMLSAAAVSPAQQAYINDLQSQVGTFLASKLDGAFSVVNYPAGFNYGITYGSNAYYNPATLKDIDTLLGISSSGQLELTGAGFSNLYAQILPAVTFNFSQADQQTMNAQDTAASSQIASVLQEFQNAGGNFSTPLPLGGKLQDVFNQLTKLYGSLDKIPDTLNALRNAVASYKASAANSYALHNRQYAATARIAAAVANTVKPDANNGGMQTDNAKFYVGYTPEKLPSANQLLGSLATASNAVTVAISLSNFSSTNSNFSVSGGTSFNIPIASILNISIGASASYDLSRYTSSSSQVAINITYPGVTLFSSTPSVLSTDNSTGWYAADILEGVIANTGRDATGYQLQGSEFNIPDEFGPGKAFSRLKTFVISQQPTVTMTFSAADVSKITSDLQVGAKINVSLFGIFSLGSASSSYSVQKVETSSQSGSVTVTFGPPQVSGTIPLQQQVAFVLGGVASYPPNNV